MNCDTDKSKNLGVGKRSGSRLDIAAHTREPCSNGYFNNLLCIEMKKRNQPESDKQSDRDRLKTLTKATGGYLFGLGVFIIADKERLEVDSVYSYYVGDAGDEAHKNPNQDTEIKTCWLKEYIPPAL